MRPLVAYRWHLAQTLVVMALVYAFLAWAPWLAARAIRDLTPEVAKSLPPDCPAASVNHGE
jgi:hypothetical protein